MGDSTAQSGKSPQAVERSIAWTASQQHGNVTRAQLTSLGLTRHKIERRVRTGYLLVEHRGVYSVGRPARTPLERSMAAVLACGPGAVLSLWSALALWGLAPWPSKVHVSVLADRRQPKIAVHRVAALAARDVRHRSGMSVTSPARTVLDCAPHMTEKALTRAVNAAIRAGDLTPGAIAEVIERLPEHRGARLLRPFVDFTGAPTRSGFEDDFKAFCAEHGLPAPQINNHVNGYEVDAYFPAERLIVELDGEKFHHDRRSFETDRARDAEHLAAGIVTLRITWKRLRDHPAREAEWIRQILAQRR